MARILDFGESAHRRLQSLLPWYLNGTLDESERRTLDNHLPDCEACRAELAQLHSMVDLLDAESADAQAESAFARIGDRLDRPAPAGGLSAWLRGGLRDWIIRGTLVAQFALVLVLGSALLQRDEAPAYRTLSQDGRAVTERLFVRFDASRTEADIRAALVRADARIVDGPTDDGLYVLQSAQSAAVAKQALVRDRIAADVQTVEVR